MPRLKREEHAISLEVWNARPYVRWETDDIEPVRAAYADLPTTLMTKIAKQHGGYVITRHAPPLGLDKIYAEIRPDEAVLIPGHQVTHYHGDGPVPDGVAARHVHSPRNMRFHIGRDKFAGDHAAINSQVVHRHHDPAKYVFPPTPTIGEPYFHAHGKLRPDRLARHLEHDHRGEDTAETHSHSYRVKDPGQDLAKRLDVHPMALPKLPTADTVFFVIEGCVKADAVLSAGASVFSVPSVTLWDCAELPAFAARYLVRKTVVIVPDADWARNSLVYTQARLCQTRLVRLGISAHVAAPPLSAGHKGIDDFLAAGGTLDELEVLDRRLGGFAMTYLREDQLQRDAEYLYALKMHADPQGQLCLSVRALARVFDVHHSKVQRALKDLESLHAITIDGDLTIRPKGWVARNFYSREMDWEDQPIITVSEELQAEDLPPVKLRDFLTNLQSAPLGGTAHAH
jgi:hypothetical protein